MFGHLFGLDHLIWFHDDVDYSPHYLRGREWRVFGENPLARALRVALHDVLVCLSASLNANKCRMFTLFRNIYRMTVI